MKKLCERTVSWCNGIFHNTGKTLQYCCHKRVHLEYHIVGTFSKLVYQKYLAKNVWQMDRFGHKGIDLCKIWMVLVWRIISNLPSSPDFAATRRSHQLGGKTFSPLKIH